MAKIRICTDIDEARVLWEHNWPRSSLFDLWDVRFCFHSQYERPPYFVLASKGSMLYGMAALSWIDEAGYFGHFPGEVWHNRTWLEQNRILSGSHEGLRCLWDEIPAAVNIRYLTPMSAARCASSLMPDEIGYLFIPEQYDYAFQNYWKQFSGKSRKKIRHELNRLESLGVSYRYNHLPDMDHLLRYNLENYGRESYFNDPRFLRAFIRLAGWLSENDMLRLTTILIGGKIAAVDMGAIWKKTYTVLAGCTHADFPGVAKLINLHHMEWACRQRLAAVDFLCGDFNWKDRFHLTPRPLYQISRPAPQAYERARQPHRSAAYAG